MKSLPFAPRGLALLLAALVACGPSEWPIPELPAPENGERALLILIHGGGDDPTSWADDAAIRIREQMVAPTAWRTWVVDWRESAADRGAASRAGQFIGQELGARLATSSWSHVHVVAHSVAGWMADAISRAIPPPGERPFTLHVTYLDPFVFDGLFAEDGLARFGSGADWADTWFGRNDNVPWTNDAPRATAGVDVSARVPSTVERGHWAVVEQYLGSLEAPGTDGLGLHVAAEITGIPWQPPASLPVGSVRVLESL